MVHTGPVFPNCSTISSVKAGKGPDFIDFAVLEKKVGQNPQATRKKQWSLPL